MDRIVASIVEDRSAGIGVLEWLSLRFRYCGREEWSRLIDGGTISLNGATTRDPEAVLRAGDRVAFDPETVVEPEVDGDFRIVYDGDGFLVIDKPPRLPCHPGGRFFKHTLWYLLREGGIVDDPVRFATRLDRETSGLLLVCRTAEAGARADALRREGLLEKDYLVMVHGGFPDSLVARGFLVHDATSEVRKKRAFVAASEAEGADGHGEGGQLRGEPGGRPGGGREWCETIFETVARDSIIRSGERIPLSLVRARLVTGRTHQIRATLRSLGYPVVGDKLYGLDDAMFLRFSADQRGVTDGPGGRESPFGALTAEDGERLILPHQALHAYRLSFPSPSGGRVELTAPPPWKFPPEPASLGAR